MNDRKLNLGSGSGMGMRMRGDPMLRRALICDGVSKKTLTE